MKLTLFPTGAASSACGKAILVGEHAVVYGYRAIATALPGLELSLVVEAMEEMRPRSWQEAWFEPSGDLLPLPEREALGLLWNRALELVVPGRTLEDFVPQRVVVASPLPRGAGMGSSAALSVATLRLFAPLRGGVSPSVDEANWLDTLFHGRASGLDVATVLGGGVVEYVKGQLPIPLVPAKPFWLVLVDSGTRASTKVQVERVAAARERDLGTVDKWLAQLGRAAQGALTSLRTGCFLDVGKSFAEAHQALVALGLSCPELDRAVALLRLRGACGAKLTGSGGGGVAIGLFAEDPSWLLEEDWENFSIFIARIPGKDG